MPPTTSRTFSCPRRRSRPATRGSLAVALLAAVTVAGCSVLTDLDPLRADGIVDATFDAPPEASAGDGPLDESAPDATVDVAAVDAGVDADAGEPTTTCLDQNFAPGFFHGCSANAVATSPGGLPVSGTYANVRTFGMPYCPIAMVLGSALVYQENGGTFMRWVVVRKVNTQDPGTTSRGTYLVQASGDGGVTLREVCDPQNLGKSKSGSLQAADGGMTFTWADGQDVWSVL